MIPVKADLVICSSVIGVSTWIVQECGFYVCSHYLDFSSCRIVPGFASPVINLYSYTINDTHQMYKIMCAAVCVILKP